MLHKMNYENSIFTFILQLISLQSTMSLSRDSDNKSNLGCFYLLTVMNKATRSCCVSVYFQIFLVCVPKSGIVGSNDNSRFNILINYQIIFPSNYIILCSQPLCMRVPIYTHALQYLLLSFIYYYIHPSVICGK